MLYVVVLFITVGILLSIMVSVLGTENIVDCEDFGSDEEGVYVSGRTFVETAIGSNNFGLMFSYGSTPPLYQDRAVITTNHTLGDDRVFTLQTRHGAVTGVTDIVMPYELDMNDFSGSDFIRVFDMYVGDGTGSNLVTPMYATEMSGERYCIGCMTAEVWRDTCDMVSGNSITGSSMLVLILLVIAAVAIIGTLRMMG